MYKESLNFRNVPGSGDHCSVCVAYKQALLQGNASDEKLIKEQWKIHIKQDHWKPCSACDGSGIVAIKESDLNGATPIYEYPGPNDDWVTIKCGKCSGTGVLGV